MSKNTEFPSVGPPGSELNMSPRNSQAQSPLTDVSSTPKHAQKTKNSPEAVTNSPKEAHPELNGEESYYFTQNPYAYQYYTQYVHLYHMLDSSFAAIHSELSYMGRNVSRLTNGMKECSDTMNFYVTRMLSLQKETLHTLDKTNSSLQSAVRLLREIKENQEQRPQSSSNATQHIERDKVPEESDGASTWSRKRENRHRSRSWDRSTQHSKRYKDK